MPDITLHHPPDPLIALWAELAAADARSIARNSGAGLEGEALRLCVAGKILNINIRERAITVAADKTPVPFLWQLLALQYLLRAQDLPLAGRWVNPLELAGGDFFFRGPHAFKMGPLEERFGRDREGFIQVGKQLGGHPLDLADASFTLPALPRIPAAYLLWCGDEEFPAKVNVLLDATADQQLPLDMIWTLVNLVNKQLIILSS